MISLKSALSIGSLLFLEGSTLYTEDTYIISFTNLAFILSYLIYLRHNPSVSVFGIFSFRDQPTYQTNNDPEEEVKLNISL